MSSPTQIERCDEGSADLFCSNQQIDCSQIIYKNFSIKSIQSFLGISIQQQKMYVVQKKCISVFQYYPPSLKESSQDVEQRLATQKVPSLVKQIFLPFQISRYVITEKYICIKSKSKIQIRDIQFEKVFYVHNQGIIGVRTPPEVTDKSAGGFIYDTIEQLELESQIIDDSMLSWKVITKRNKANSTDARYIREYWSQQLNILTNFRSFIRCHSELVDPSNKTRQMPAICKPPLFINQLGYIQNFYIWPITQSDIQIGIFYNYKQHSQKIAQNALYEICSFPLKDLHIKNIFYYEFRGSKGQVKAKDGPQLFIIVCESPSKQNPRIKIIVFEVLPQQKITNQEQSQNDALNHYLEQFNQLKKQKKYSQRSLSNNVLLNEILADSQSKGVRGVSASRPASILQSYTLRQSVSFRKSFYNPATKVLWIDDSNQISYKIKFVESGDLQAYKEQDLSFVEKIQEYRNENMSFELEGVMYDTYPIYKQKVMSLQIGLRGPLVHQQIYHQERKKIRRQIQEQKSKSVSNLSLLNQLLVRQQYRKNDMLSEQAQIKSLKQQLKINERSNENAQKRQFKEDEDESGVIQFNDKQLQKIDKEKMEQSSRINEQVKSQFDKQVNEQNSPNLSPTLDNFKTLKPSNLSISPQKSTQIPIHCNPIQETHKLFSSIETQTDEFQKIQQIPQISFPSTVTINNLPQLLTQLNFDKVQQILIRFSSLFNASVTKNTNKLRQQNKKAKEQIKMKINGDIYELIKQVFQPLMGEALGEKISKQVIKAREFVQKLITKNLEHFSLIVMEQGAKQESIKKNILEEQLRAVQAIKQASFKFMDVTKVREMQKIAYNELVVQQIKEVGDKLQEIQDKVNLLISQSVSAQEKLFEDVKEIKEMFQLMVQLEDDSDEENSKKRRQDKNSDQDQEQSSCSGQRDSQDQSDSQEENIMQETKGKFRTDEQRRVPYSANIHPKYDNYPPQQGMHQYIPPPPYQNSPMRQSEWHSPYSSYPYPPQDSYEQPPSKYPPASYGYPPQHYSNPTYPPNYQQGGYSLPIPPFYQNNSPNSYSQSFYPPQNSFYGSNQHQNHPKVETVSRKGDKQTRKKKTSTQRKK